MADALNNNDDQWFLPGPFNQESWDLRWDDLFLPIEFRSHLVRSLIRPIREQNPPLHFGYIVFGPPGTGKTALVKSIAKQLDWDLYLIGPKQFVQPGKSVEEAIKICFENIKTVVSKKIATKREELGLKEGEKDPPANIIFGFDEIDELVSSREDQTDRQTRFTTTMMLTLFQDLRDDAKKQKFVFFVLTNHIERFDPAITRRGRFDLILPLGPPDRQSRFLLFEKFLNELAEEHKDNYNIIIRRKIDKISGNEVIPQYITNLDVISRASAGLTLKEIDAVCGRVVEQQIAMENFEKEPKDSPDYLNLETRYFIDWVHSFRDLSESKTAVEKFYHDKEIYARGSSIYSGSNTIQEQVEHEFRSLHIYHNLTQLHNKWKVNQKNTIKFSFRNLAALSFFEGQILALAKIGNVKEITSGDKGEYLSPSQKSNDYELTLTPKQSGKMKIIFYIKAKIDLRGIEEALAHQHAWLEGNTFQVKEITIIN